MSLARLEKLESTTRLDQDGPSARAVAAGCDLAVPLQGVLDLTAETRRLQREIDKVTKEREGHSRKLSNADFIGKARPEVIEKVRRIDAELEERLTRLSRTLHSLNPSG